MIKGSVLGRANGVRFLGILLAVAEAWHVYATFCLLFIVSSMVSWPEYHLNEDWTLGQIIAVAIWAPVIVEWIRVLLSKGSMYRVSKVKPD